MLNNNILRTFMARAYVNASGSPDLSSQNGAVLTKDGVVVADGYNHFYDGVPGELKDREQKLKQIEHAERDIIYQAATRGIKTEGSILICPWAACCDCARAIIGAHCHGLIYHRQRYLVTDERWIDQIDEALKWVKDAGIWVYELDGCVPQAPSILISGKKWSPASCSYVS